MSSNYYTFGNTIFCALVLAQLMADFTTVEFVDETSLTGRTGELFSEQEDLFT